MMKTKGEVEGMWVNHGASVKAARALATLRCEDGDDIRQMGRDNFAKLDGLGSITVDEIMGLVNE